MCVREEELNGACTDCGCCKKQTNEGLNLLEELLSGEIGPDEFEQDGVGNRKG